MASATKKLLMDPFSDNNPITVQVLGICSALAVTVKVETAIVMALALTSVVSLSNLVISLMRNLIPSGIRMIVEMAVDRRGGDPGLAGDRAQRHRLHLAVCPDQVGGRNQEVGSQRVALTARRPLAVSGRCGHGHDLIG